MSQTKIDIEGGWAPTPHWAQRGDYFESGAQKLLYIALADRRDAYGYCHPSLSQLSHDAMCSRSTVLKNLKGLEAMGLITRRSRSAQDGGHLSNEYYVTLDAPTPTDEPREVDSEPRVGRQRTEGGATAYQHIRTSVKNQVNNHVNTPIAPNGGVSDTTPEDSETDNQTEGQSALFDAPTEPENNPKRRASTGYTDEFEAFWAIYPLKLDERTAFKAFTRALKRVKLDVIMAGVRKYADDPNLPEPRFIKHASTWLNGDGWDNPPLPSSKPVSGRPNRAESTFNNAVNIAKQFYAQEYGSAPQDTNLLGGLQ